MNSSPFFRRFGMPGLPVEDGQNLTISEVVNGINRAALLGRVDKKECLSGPFSTNNSEETIIRASKILIGYFDELRDANVERWEAGKTAYISVNPGIRAHLQLISEVIKYTENKDGIVFNKLSIQENISRITSFCAPVYKYVESASDKDIEDSFSRKFGEGGVKEYTYKLYSLISQEKKDFGSEEFKIFEEQKNDIRVTESDRIVTELNGKIHDFVIRVLKDIHGDERIQSGDKAYWAYGIKSPSAKTKAVQKQLADPANKQLAPEAYLEILDLRDIIKQDNNWHVFEPIFNIMLNDERKGKKYYLKWLSDFNELRRIPAHKSSLRTYNEENYMLLDQIKTEVPKRMEQYKKSIKVHE